MSLTQFLDAPSAPTRSLLVVNRTAPNPVQRMLEDAFADQPVTVDEEQLPGTDSNTVLLVEEADDGLEVVATSPLEALQNTILLVNSDLYKTGAAGITKLELPDVLAGLDDVPLRLRGYPESNNEKLLLIAISRYIERRAWLADGGTLRASFQRLSRINDERGTRFVYETLAESPVKTHVYGIPDWQPPAELGVIAHGGHSSDFRDSWFVVFTPPEDWTADSGEPAASPAALLAIEVAPRKWRGYWTFDPELVSEIDEYIATNL